MAKRLVVVGGGAGGPSAAAKAKRVDPSLEVTILEAGEHVSFSA
jgi:flavin-dependent dehydrogenase